MKKTKFDLLFEEIMDKFNKSEITETTDIASEQIVIDAIEDEFIGNGEELKENWKMSVSPIVTYIEDNLPEDKTILTIDYLDLIKLIRESLTDLNLFV